jgi:hypothetical protein
MAFAWPGIPAMALTPDGETPAIEDVCDQLIGGTPGLYGLCVAYCEAQDCDSEAARSGQCTRTPPNEVVLRNYNRKMQPGDPAMPCLAPPTSACPCWTEAEVETIQILDCNFYFGEGAFLSATGDQGEIASIDLNSRTCALENATGIADRNSTLDDEELEACANLLEQAANNDSINCRE